MISIIIPVYNEEKTISSCLQSLITWRKQGCEIIFVDGGSDDNTFELAGQYGDHVYMTGKGRAVQMNEGARHAKGEFLLFLHSDTVLPAATDKLIQLIISDKNRWGRFDVTLSGESKAYRVLEFFINIRSRITGISTGDQGMFMHKSLFEHANGFPEIPLMEDITLSRILLKNSRPVCLKERVITSSRRWENNGIIKTILLMWYLRAAYFFGVKPEQLARLYAG